MRPLAGSDPSGWVSIQAAGAPRIRIGFRSIEERRRVVDWLNDGLRDGRPGRLAAEYPLLFERNASAIHFTLWEGESPAAFCALWAVTFRVGVHRLRAGMISLVYTDPAFRGRGHASRILETAIEHAVGLELGLILLWSDLDRLYAPLGFDRAGHESLLVLDADTVETALLSERPAPSLEVRPAAPGDWPEIERLRGHRTCQLELDPGDLARARAIPDLDALVAHDALGIRGFALRGRGDDLGEVVHEWGGDVGAALLCCAAHLSARRAGDSLFLMTPPRRDALAWALRDAGAHRVHQSLAWMRIASPQAFAHDVAAMLPAAQGLQLEPETKTTESPRRFRLRSAHGETVTTQQQVFAALFGRADGSAPSACAGALSPVLDDAARSTLPIPFFVWGLESI